jgi:hypothetical protein
MNQIIRNFLLCIAILSCSNALYAQIQFTGSDLAAIEATTPTVADQLPVIGTFYSAACPQNPPAPINVFGFPAWDLGDFGTTEIYLLDDLSDGGSGGGYHAMDDLEPPIPEGGDDGGGTYCFTNTYSFPTNGLWLQITNISGGLVYANLNGATDYVYEIFSATNLSPPMTVSNWDIAAEVFPGISTNTAPFSVFANSEPNFFLWARDWTGITSHGNTVPDWWLYYWFGTAGLALSDSDLDPKGNTLLSDYANELDPNVIGFFISVTNNYVNTANPMLQLSVEGGTPDFHAILVNDTNLADAVWYPYTSSNVMATLDTDGVYNVSVGLRGRPANATATWQGTTLILLANPPVIAVTNPTSATVSQPMI